MRLLIALLLLVGACQAVGPADAARSFSTGPMAAQSASPAVGGPRVRMGDRAIAVEIADTDASRRQGLSGRASLAPDTGMVLAWSQPTTVGIWMPDMAFALDVVFVRAGRVVFLTRDARPCPPDGPCPTFGPPTPVDWVLEVPAGSAAAWGLAVGDPIALER